MITRADREWFLVGLYVMVVALTTGVSGTYGPLAAVIDSLPGIGLAIAIRNGLQDLWDPKVALRLAVLVALGTLGSAAVNLGHLRIAVASCAAFAVANVGATVLYRHNRPASVVVFAVLDSLVFPAVAFGAFTWWVVGGQIVAKIIGAAVWTYVGVVVGRALSSSSQS